MIDNLIGGIARQLHERFGETYTIYQDQIPQGFREPCFFLMMIGTSVSPIPNGRYAGKYALDVHYFPKRKGKRGELFSISEQLMDLLECVTLLDGTKSRGFNLHSEVADNVLHVLAEYEIRWADSVPQDMMEQVDVTTNTQKGERNGSKGKN